MRDKKEIDAKHIRAAIKELNEAELLDKAVPHVGKNKDQLIKGFTDGIESIPEGKKAPDDVAGYYNWMFSDEIDGQADAANPYEGGASDSSSDSSDKKKDTKGAKDSKEPKEKKERKSKGISKDSRGFKTALCVYGLIKRRKTMPSLEDFTTEVNKKFDAMSEGAVKSELSKLRLVHKYASGDGKEGTKMATMIDRLKAGKAFPPGMKHTTFTARAYAAYVEVFGD